MRRARIPGGYAALMWFPGRVPTALAWVDFTVAEAMDECAAPVAAIGFPTLPFDCDKVELADGTTGAALHFEMEKRI